MKRLVLGLLVTGAVTVGAVVPALAFHNGSSRDHNVAICHKGRTIFVSPRAIPGHLRHGDTTGACQAATQTSTPTREATPTSTPTETPTSTPTPTPTPTV